ncbi:unnamed protein product [Hermetia illucens]|uniref:Ubiquitin-protein ligase E3C n=1 Tax=Hermetia illucens TaxID=343691 RepID=A0A7R8YWE4_HERIL|nr:ubiquitin-protein ligase E3C [Hermetia illucens]CAD7088328.1 unnamed protein product [Hermetia illucens]
MYGFDGDYRRRPIQSLGGRSQNNDRETIIRKAQQERQKRNELRRQNNGAIVLQSYARSFIDRQRKKHSERELFDQYYQANKNYLGEEKNLEYLLKRLTFFYCKTNEKDRERLIDICQCLIRNPQKPLTKSVSDALWLHRMKRVLFICLEQLTVPNIPPAIPLRVLETFTTDTLVEKYLHNEEYVGKYLDSIFKFLIDRKYFKVIRSILEYKCPPLDGITTHPPNQFTDALYQMLIRPLILLNRGIANGTFISQSFVEHILAPKFSEPIQYFILPCLSQLKEFPFANLLIYLENAMTKMSIDNDDNSFGELSTFVLYSVLTLDQIHLDKLHNASLLASYIRLISEISSNVLNLPKSSKVCRDEDGDSTDSDSDEKSVINITVIEQNCLLEIIEMLNEANRAYVIVSNVGLFIDKPDILYCLCRICHNLMIYNKAAIFDYKLLYSLAFNPEFIRTLWYTMTSQSNQLGFSSPLSLLSKGVVPKVNSEMNRIIPILATFCALFGRLVPTLHDGEFCQEDLMTDTPNKLMPFTISEIIPLSKTLKEISIGLVELAFPDTRSNLNEHYRSVLGRSDVDEEDIQKSKQIWANLLKVVVSVLNQIYTRDLRKGFCPEGHWTVQTLNLPLDKPTDLPLTRGSRRGPRPFQPIRDFTRADFEDGPPMSIKQIRSITILREIPFVVPFSTRVGILQGLVAADKLRVQGEFQGFLQGPSIQFVVRRSHLYEDAFDKLRPENEPDLRHRFRVQFISSIGLEEVGVDGGGLFREFLSELIKTAFDPNRGFFKVTTDNKLYPNPSVSEIVPDFAKHYYFIGRILGKAIYENLLVELPLADFFLSKLAGKHSDLDVHQLASLDPELYRNLLSLKAYEGDVSELGLDFTVVTNDLGKTKIEELKPNGQSIQVTSANRIEYIQLMADYKLNKQIRQHCIAFRKGLSNVLPVEWLYMFSNKELQVLISGAEIPIDIEDLKKHCRYGGEYSPTHPTIICFWSVVESFSDIEKRQLLRFVTSCSRPPLLGFKDLDPPFFIQNAGDEERLPTASTCTNLLKLPAFKTGEQMKEKLLYAIQSGAGFELS